MRKLVFTNGCFDVIHLGHVKLLEFCSLHGEVIVGINSDASIKRLKGDTRPINPQYARKEILEAIKFVNSVEIFEEDTPYELIKRVKPDLIVKGSDYEANKVIGFDLAKVLIFPRIEDFSSSNIIKKSHN